MSLFISLNRVFIHPKGVCLGFLNHQQTGLLVQICMQFRMHFHVPKIVGWIRQVSAQEIAETLKGLPADQLAKIKESQRCEVCRGLVGKHPPWKMNGWNLKGIFLIVT